MEVATGTKCWDWTIPKEWNIKDAYIEDSTGNKIVDFKKSNLHILGYSTPINTTLTLKQLKEHLYSDPDRPDAIPYRVSYYKERWGFCLTHNQLLELKEGSYKVVIDSKLTNGSMTYAELVIPGESAEEVLLSTYICHPSMGNNELSGIVVTTFIAKWLQAKKNKKTYRILFVPETLGSICYMSHNIKEMQKNVIAGFNITCIGDDRIYSYIESRIKNTLADKVASHIIKNIGRKYKIYPFIKSGSDERQYCSPGANLPVVSLMRSKYDEYDEYHSSLDNLSTITESGLLGGYTFVKKCIQAVEVNETLKLTVMGTPQLGKRDLYPSIRKGRLDRWHRNMVDMITYMDGKNDLIDIANILKVDVGDLTEIVRILKSKDLLVRS
jgi:aminopeptidase-like protein